MMSNTTQNQIDALVNAIADLIWQTADTAQLGNNRAREFRENMRIIRDEQPSVPKKNEILLRLEKFTYTVLANELEYMLDNVIWPKNWSMPASKALLERLRQE